METFIEKRKRKIRKVRVIFIALMLAYPVAQFLVTFVYVNSETIRLAFSGFDVSSGKYVWVGAKNFGNFFKLLQVNANARKIIYNSLFYMPVTCFILLPVSVISAYFLFKKMPLAKIFRFIFFLPSIIPIVALTLAFKLSFDSDIGPATMIMRPILRVLHAVIPAIPAEITYFGAEPNAQIMIFIYCLWAGVGYNIVLVTGAISRVPVEIYESCRLEGVGFFRELFQFVVPLIWPTVVTMFMLGMTSVLTVYLQPMLLTNGRLNTYTISFDIFISAQTGKGIENAAASGLMLSLIGAPVILGIRAALNGFFKDVDF
jgi:ABC-type sugar transport system permease subunit